MPAKKFLAPQARAGDGYGYLNQPPRPLPEGHMTPDDPDTVARIRDRTQLCDEPEAIGRAIVNPYTELARTYDRLRHAAEVEQAQQLRACLNMEARMAEARRRAKMQHVRVDQELLVIRHMLDRARRGGRPDPPAAIQRLEGLEARLDHRPDLDEAA